MTGERWWGRSPIKVAACNVEGGREAEIEA